MKINIVKITLKNTVKYIMSLIVLSMAIAYLTLQISMNIKYAVDGILFENYDVIPEYINMILNNNYVYDLLIIATIIVALNFVCMILKYCRDRITTKVKLKININLKSALYKHVLILEYESYNSYDKSEIMQRINEDADVYTEFFNSQFNTILDIVFLCIFIITEKTIVNLPIYIYILITIMILILFSLWYLKRLNIRIEEMVNKKRSLLKTTIINVNNFKLIRMFNKQEEEKKRYKKLNEDYTKESIKFIKLVLFYEIFSEHIAYLKNPIIYMIGGIAIIKR